MAWHHCNLCLSRTGSSEDFVTLVPDALLDRVVVFSDRVVEVGAAILKHMSARVCNVPTHAADMLERLARIPAIGDRWRRSAARSGAILAFGAMVDRYPKDNFRKITSSFLKVDKDDQEINPQEVMERAGPIACRLAQLVETDEFVEDEARRRMRGRSSLPSRISMSTPLWLWRTCLPFLTASGSLKRQPSGPRVAQPHLSAVCAGREVVAFKCLEYFDL